MKIKFLFPLLAAFGLMACGTEEPATPATPAAPAAGETPAAEEAEETTEETPAE